MIRWKTFEQRPEPHTAIVVITQNNGVYTGLSYNPPITYPDFKAEEAVTNDEGYFSPSIKECKFWIYETELADLLLTTIPDYKKEDLCQEKKN